MKSKQQLVIILPDVIAGIPVRIIRGSHCNELVLNLSSNDEEGVYCFSDCVSDEQRKYAFIWNKECLEKVSLEEIMWIEADGSYSIFHLTGNRKRIVSFKTWL